MCNSAGELLFNLHAADLFDEIAIFLGDLSKSKMPLWQQMRTMEILSATLAADLIGNGIVFNIDKDEISWPNGEISRAPTNSKRKGGKKKPIATSKHGIFGKVVHDYGPKGMGAKPKSDAVVVSKNTGNEAAGDSVPKSTPGKF